LSLLLSHCGWGRKVFRFVRSDIDRVEDELDAARAELDKVKKEKEAAEAAGKDMAEETLTAEKAMEKMREDELAAEQAGYRKGYQDGFRRQWAARVERALTFAVLQHRILNRAVIYSRPPHDLKLCEVAITHQRHIHQCSAPTATDHICDPTKRKKKHLSWATPPWPFIWFLRFATADVLFTFSKTIFNIPPNERVQFVLGAALRNYQVGVFGPGNMNLLGWELKWRGFDCREGFVELKNFCCKGETRSGFWALDPATEKNLYCA
jgi:hypothetical protein